jgi:hypothetical protein
MKSKPRLFIFLAMILGIITGLLWHKPQAFNQSIFSGRNIKK